MENKNIIHHIKQLKSKGKGNGRPTEAGGNKERDTLVVSVTERVNCVVGQLPVEEFLIW